MNTSPKFNELSDLQKVALSDIAISYVHWKKLRGITETNGWQMLQKTLEKNKIDTTGWSEFEKGMLMGIYMTVGNWHIITQAKGLMQLSTGVTDQG
jgi:hypothetical protein